MRRVVVNFLAVALLLLSGGIGVRAQSQADNPLWLRYPAISPDGGKIAFCYQGVLFVVPSAGGSAKAITTGQDYVSSPVWSPDGKSLAFASDRHGNFDIFTIPVEGGTPSRVTEHSAREVPMAYNPSGDSIYFRANYMPSNSFSGFFAYWSRPLFRVSVKGGTPTRVLTHPAANIDLSKDGRRIIFEDVKGNEDDFRKHHVSSISRDIWLYDAASGQVRQLINRAGEDRNPRFTADGNGFYFLSEREGGSMNIYRATISNPQSATQLTRFEKHPVRDLSLASNGNLCFTYDGEIYTLREGAQPARVPISIVFPNSEPKQNNITYTRGADQAVISPDGKEVAFVVRGDVFVTSVKHGVTKRITNTPTQERSVDFGADNRTLVYAGERDGSWNLYLAKIARSEEPNFAGATEITEEVLLQDGHQNFQPKFSPDGKEVAFLRDRTQLMVINIATKKVRQITDGSENYSYSDGDLSFDWSPDGKWLVMDYFDKERWPNNDIGVASAAGGQPIINITQNGYTDVAPRFMMNGEMIIWFGDRQGLREHASWGAQNDVYAFFTTQEAYDKFMQTAFEDELAEKSDADSEKADEEESKSKKKGKKEKKGPEKPAIRMDFTDPEKRIVRLTIHSSTLSDAIVTPDGKTLYYLARFEGRYNLWKTDLKKRDAKKVLNLDVGGSSITLDAKGENMLIASSSKLVKVNLKSEKQENVSYSARFLHEPAKEREYMFHHAWQQVKDKFYRTDLHGVDWDFYRESYARFLPHINNNYDFADMLSEMLGELNASHTGSGYRAPGGSQAASTAALGLFYDMDYTGKGIKVTGVLRDGPFDKANSKMRAGSIITRIDGEEVNSLSDLPRLLNRKSGERVRIDFTQGSEVVKPISIGRQSNLLYDRWVRQRREEVDRLSNGRLGYVHIRSMSGDSYRDVYSEIFGLYNDREGMVIDTRYNGGGHLHEDIEVLFSGEKYLDLVPREHMISEHPRKRWKKPSIMVIGEANYSNAHGTPWVYKTRKLGQLVGMPVPGTMTSVWWETQIDPTLYFGVPIVGYIDANGNYLENQQLEPDVRVQLDYNKVWNGHDTQIEKAVEVLLKECDKVKATSPWVSIDAKYRK